LLVVLALATSTGASAPFSTTTAGRLPIREAARDYLRVMKPGIIVLLLITTVGAMLVAGPWPSIWLVLATMLGGALASGGASALNCYFDRDIDPVMARTRKRPLPTGRLTPSQVRNFGLILSALAVVELWLLVNPLAALLALAGNVFYVMIYTRWLKRSTPQNIVIGGAAGAFPPLVGWAAVTGTITLPALLLFAIIFYWTPPHFWSLALLKARDYERAGIPMLPVTHGAQYTRKLILLYALLLVGITLIVVPAGAAGWLYLTLAIALGGVFVGLAAKMYVEGTSRLAWRLFKFSNYYLTLILAAMVLDRAV
jgi:protoheme IX farnesyltransferase